MFESGADVDLRAVVDDDYGGFGWRNVITHNGETVLDEPAYDKAELIDPEFRAALNLSNLEDGIWTITVEAEDHGDNVTAQTVTFQVGEDIPMGEDETGPDTGTTTMEASGSEGPEEPDDGTAGVGPGIDDPAPEGCACQSGSPSPSAPLWAPVPLLLLAAIRRRL